MKAQVNKKWWQFWLPREVDIKIPDSVRLEHTPVSDNPFAAGLTEIPDHFKGQVGDNQGSAIEADEAEPWYGGDAVEDEDGSVVTAEPPIVYANRGNARMEERRQARERQQ